MWEWNPLLVSPFSFSSLMSARSEFKKADGLLFCCARGCQVAILFSRSNPGRLLASIQKCYPFLCSPVNYVKGREYKIEADLIASQWGSFEDHWGFEKAKTFLSPLRKFCSPSLKGFSRHGEVQTQLFHQACRYTLFASYCLLFRCLDRR